MFKFGSIDLKDETTTNAPGDPFGISDGIITDVTTIFDSTATFDEITSTTIDMSTTTSTTRPSNRPKTELSAKEKKKQEKEQKQQEKQDRKHNHQHNSEQNRNQPNRRSSEEYFRNFVAFFFQM